MDALVDVLMSDADGVVDDAALALGRSNELHYAQIGPEGSRALLADLLGLIASSITHRDLVPMIDYATRIANERFDAGFDIREVQRAFHVMEEAIWTRVIAATPPEELAQSLGLVSTVVGAGRDALARTYVSRASQQHVPSLDLSALFRGGT
jgi:hypothetical protein